MKREQTLIIPFVTLIQDDLADIAERIEAHFSEHVAEAQATYDADSDHDAKWDATTVERLRKGAARARSRLERHDEEDEVDEELVEYVTESEERLELAIKEAKANARQRLAQRDEKVRDMVRWRRPKYTVATKLSSFEDSDWGALWSRVSSHDVRSISMHGDGLQTGIEVRLSLVGRSEGFSNHVKLTSSHDRQFEAEYGYFQDLFRTKASPSRRALSSGALGFVLWSLSPAFVIVAIGWFLGWQFLGWTRVSGQNLWALILTVGAVSLFVSGVSGALLDRFAPRVAVLGVGPYQSARDNFAQAVAGVLLSTLGAGILVVVPWLVGSQP